jgi:hypothetical protein
MKRFAVFALAMFAFAAVAVFTPQPAEAAPIYKGSLDSWDAGSTNVLQVSKQTEVCVSCELNSCVKPLLYDGGSQGASCATDYPIQGTGNVGIAASELKVACFPMGGLNAVVAIAVDGGDPNCRVWTNTKNSQ